MQVNEVKIIPFKGIDSGNRFFQLGNTMEQIIAKYGKAAKVIEDNILKITSEYRDACILEYKNNKLVSIICSKHLNPIFDNLNLFEPENIKKLKEEYDCIDGKAYITFPALGISIGGMSKKRIPEGKVVIVFVKEEIDTYEFFANED